MATLFRCVSIAQLLELVPVKNFVRDLQKSSPVRISRTEEILVRRCANCLEILLC